ncbi:MarR family winged helix-turn-helix transcriptional regulator [Enterococcus olivae]
MEDILRDLGIIARALDSIANIEFKELALTKGQYIYLVRIYENEGIIPERLAELVKIDRTTTSRAIKKLEENGFIEKRPDDSNKKIRRLYTTEIGKQAALFILRENKHSNKVALENFNEDEVQTMKKLLTKMKNNIEFEWMYVKNGNKREY